MGANACFFTGGDDPGILNIGSGNLIMDNGTGTGPFTPCPGVVSTTDPQLFPLALNAPGNTPTMAILMSSSAAGTADSGTSFDRDQRGVVRPQSDGYDIGAYEARTASFSMASIGSLPVSVGGTNTTTVTVSSFEYFNAPVTLGVTTPPSGVTVSFSPNPLTPPYNGSVSSTMTVTLAPFVTPGSYTPTITRTSGAINNSVPATITVPAANTSSITNVIGQLFGAGCVDNLGIVDALTSKLVDAQAAVNQNEIQMAIGIFSPLSWNSRRKTASTSPHHAASRA